MSTRRDLNSWMTHHPVEALAAAAGLVAVSVIARVNPTPELGFVLQTLGAGGALGLVVAYLRYRDDPEGDRWRTVAEFSVLGLLTGVLVVIADLVGLI
ncbi:MAG: hypothetical protein ACRDKH_06850 [Solirubrobacterales bacterium]